MAVRLVGSSARRHDPLDAEVSALVRPGVERVVMDVFAAAARFNAIAQASPQEVVYHLTDLFTSLNPTCMAEATAQIRDEGARNFHDASEHRASPT